MVKIKHFKKLISIENQIQKEYMDVVVIPSWLLKSILKYDNELLNQPYNSLSEYEKGVVDTIRKQQETVSINFDKL